MVWVKCWCDEKSKKWFCEIEAIVTQPDIVDVIHVVLPNGYGIDMKCKENVVKVWFYGKMVMIVGKEQVVLEIWL